MFYACYQSAQKSNKTAPPASAAAVSDLAFIREVTGDDAPPAPDSGDAAYRRQVARQLRERGYAGSDFEVDVLLRGSQIRYGTRGSLHLVNGRLTEYRPPDDEWF